MESTVEQSVKQPVDRQKTCPLLLRVFLCKNCHNPMIDYSRGNVPPKELQIYTWKDATLKEIANLVKEVHPEGRKKGTRFSFALVFPEIHGPAYRRREIGSVCSGTPGEDDKKTLSDCRIQIGDYMDIAIIYPENRYQENRFPENRFPENRFPENRYPENRFPENRFSESRKRW